MPESCKENFYTVYGEGTVNDQTYQKWFVRLCARNLSLNQALQLDRQAEIGVSLIIRMKHGR